MSRQVSTSMVDMGTPSQAVAPQVHSRLRAMVRIGQSTALKERNNTHSSPTKTPTIATPSSIICCSMR